MIVKYNRKTLPYKVLMVFILIIELHYFGLFTLPSGIEFVLYTNKAKWIGAVAVLTALICYKRHKTVLKAYTGFLRKYCAVTAISLLLISAYTIIAYPLNPLITTYGFASYYLYAFLAIPIIYIYIVEGSFERFFKLLNVITICMYIVTIIQGVAFMKTGKLLFASANETVSGGMIRDGKVRLYSGAMSFLMIIYNIYLLYNCRKERTKKKKLPLISLILGMISICFTGNSRIMLVTLLASLGILVLLGDGSGRKKILAMIAVIGAIVFLFTSGIVSKLLASFSTTGNLAGSSIARVGAYKYYLDAFLKNPLFAIGFVGDENYYDIVHGSSGIYYQTVHVRYFYDDVGIAGQLALLGISIVGIYIWPLFRIIKIAVQCCKNRQFLEGKLVIAIACYLVCTTPTMIVLDSSRVIAFPIVLASTELIYTNYLMKNGKKSK